MTMSFYINIKGEQIMIQMINSPFLYSINPHNLPQMYNSVPLFPTLYYSNALLKTFFALSP